jgi:hypothetical protein
MCIAVYFSDGEDSYLLPRVMDVDALVDACATLENLWLYMCIFVRWHIWWLALLCAMCV